MFLALHGKDYQKNPTDIQKLVNYVNELKMNRADRRFSTFSKDLKPGEHSDHEGHIKYAEYLWSHLK